MKRYFMEKEREISNEHVKACLISLGIREI